MPEQVELWRNTGQRGLLIASYKRLKKDTYRAITFHGGSLCPCTLVPASQAAAPPSRSNLTGADLPQIIKKNKSLVSMHTALLQSSPALCGPVDCSLPGFLVRYGVLQVKILGRIGQYWLPYPSGALYFQLP